MKARQIIDLTVIFSLTFTNSYKFIELFTLPSLTHPGQAFGTKNSRVRALERRGNFYFDYDSKYLEYCGQGCALVFNTNRNSHSQKPK
jgi:hypothetical protein